MAIFHLRARIITRKNGYSVVEAAAYRSRDLLLDHLRNKSFDFTNRKDLVHSVIKTPSHLKQWEGDRERLWNAVEAAEKRRDARLARELVIALPVELNEHDNIKLIDRWVEKECVNRGMVADLNVHWDKVNPHAHILLTTRNDVTGGKNRDWDRREVLLRWREAWVDEVNQDLRALGFDAKIDHRSYAERGLGRAPERVWDREQGIWR